MGSFIGAMIGTYFVSRLLLRLFAALPGPARLAAAHIGSFVVLALFVGFLKAYFTSFAARETLVFVVPQILWLALDIARGKGEGMIFGR